MHVELIGGPFDGTVFPEERELPIYLVVSAHPDAPIYKARCCRRCVADADKTYYQFIGYEQVISYEFPEKSRVLQTAESKEIDF
jgi:hypothetical protein